MIAVVSGVESPQKTGRFTMLYVASRDADQRNRVRVSRRS